jgi:predicted phage terminase large subunit-like protein
MERRRRLEILRPQTFHEFLEEVTPQWNWNLPHLKYVEPYLQSILDGAPRKIILQMPVRHGKSEFATIRFNAAFLKKFPEKKAVIGAYNHTFCTDFSRATRRILEGRIEFGEKNTANHWETAAGGSLLAVGVGVGISGRGCHLLTIDDPIRNYEEAYSQAYRNKTWNWFLNDVSTRVEPGGSIILTMARWHYDDLVGRILNSDDAKNWIVINIPALAEENDVLGRAVGEALWPERYSKERLEEIRQTNPSGFPALYQQHPEVEGGSIFKRDKWQYYTAETKPEYEYTICSLDTACKTKEENDRSVCTTWGICGNNAYLEDIWADRVAYYDLKIMLQSIAIKHQPSAIYIEDMSSGSPLVQELLRTSNLPIHPVIPRGDKEVRAHVVTPMIDQGRVFLPKDHPLLFDFLDELSRFPKATHDDIVDSVTMGLSQIFSYTTSPSITFF